MKVFGKCEYFLIFVFLLFTPVSASLPEYESSEGVYVTEIKSGDIVSEVAPHERFSPASTTKLMTALLTVEQVENLDEVVTVGEEVNAFGWGDSEAGLWPGQKLSYRDLLYALLLPSGNDAADTLGINVGRKILGDPNAGKDQALQAFVRAMNLRAKQLGCLDTSFTNTHGLYNENHYSTPYDMVQIGAKAFENPTIVQVSQTPSYNLTTSTGAVNTIRNTNKLITGNDQERSLYVLAAKTGNTSEGGRTFVFSSRQGDAYIVGALMRTSDNAIFSQSRDILLELNNNYCITELTGKNGIVKSVDLTNVHFRSNSTLGLKAAEPVYNYSRVEDKDKYTTQIRYESDLISDEGGILRLNKSIKEGDKVGALIVTEENGATKTAPLYAAQDVSVRNILDFLKENIIWLLLGLAGAVILSWYFISLSTLKVVKKRF